MLLLQIAIRQAYSLSHTALIRSLQGMNTIDDHVRKINLTLLSELPPQLALLKKLGSALKYPGRNLHSALGLALK